MKEKEKAIRYNVPVGFGEEARPWEISAPFTLPKVIMGFVKLRRRRFMIRRKPIQLGSLDSHGSTMSHEGLKTVRVDNRCDFSSYSDLCICVVTWNMNGQVTYKDMAELVGNNRKFDLLVVGLQEVPRKNISRLLQAALLDSHMGFGGLIRRKKGAVAIRLNYKGITMVFISCHLSAHAQNVEKRNSEFRNVSESLFSHKLNPYARPAQITVWLGDLNYRIQGIGNYPARDLIHNDLQRLLTNNDQLLLEAERGQIFEGYSEGTLTFKPTYKYNIGSSNYDTSYKFNVDIPAHRRECHRGRIGFCSRLKTRRKSMQRCIRTKPWTTFTVRITSLSKLIYV
ncbi:inositol polyphosphate 5-phosphatase 11 [Prunus dulcis]|uniref:Inositol polyphosphate 5-phosphatase 11 n=1 Tax=Prunus dulcis TaxID=3755 RepID=A0A4Y1QSV9_PRUDU|nr:inositol polyphosphate 5-phosphatase 11 [Prunus dulcis]